MSSSEEKILERLRHLPGRKSDRTDRVGCPDEESLASFLGEHLPREARQSIETHLTSCMSCVEDLVATFKAGEDADIPAIPHALIARAMALVQTPRGESVFDLVVRFVKDSVELVRQSGEWISTTAPQPIAVRGAPARVATGMLQVEKGLGDYKVSVEIERVENNVCHLLVRVSSADGKPADGLRLSLMSGEREQASYLARQGQAIFAGVSKGEYSLVISLATTSLGTIRLKLEGER